MAFFFHHRKLMSDSTNLTQLCASVCDLLKNPQRLCPIKSCAPICPFICPPQIMDFFPCPPTQSPPPPYIPNHHSKLSSTLKISIAFLVTTFSIFVLYTLYKFYTVWARSRRHHGPNPDQNFHDHDQYILDEDHGPVLDHPIWYIRTIGLQPSVISAITIVPYKTGEGLVEGTDCSICLTEFQEDETLRLLTKCSHAFHIPCIDTWLSSHTNCPLCRAGIVSNLEVAISLQEPVIENPSLVEETHVETSINNVEFEGEREDGSSELRIGSEDENDIMSKLEMGSNSMMRRSISLDTLSAARISAEIANAHPSNSDGDLGTKLDKADRLDLGVVPTRVEGNCSSCSIARSLQRGPDFIRRSLSCSGKVLFSRQSR